MKITINMTSDLTEEEIQHLLQSIRDCEQAFFPEKELSILVIAPELSTDKASAMLGDLKPAFKYGPTSVYTFRPPRGA